MAPQCAQCASTHQAIAGAMCTRAVPCGAASCQAGRSRSAEMSKSSGTVKSWGFLVACTTFEWMRDSRNVRTASRRWHLPTRYHSPATNCRPYGSTTRSSSRSCEMA